MLTIVADHARMRTGAPTMASLSPQMRFAAPTPGVDGRKIVSGRAGCTVVVGERKVKVSSSSATDIGTGGDQD